MNVRRELRLGRLAALVAMAVGLAAACGVRAGESRVLFEKDVAPILQAHCLKCHGDGKIKGGLDLRRWASLVAGGDSGPAVVAGKPADSLIIQRIAKGEMPPPKEGALD